MPTKSNNHANKKDVKIDEQQDTNYHILVIPFLIPEAYYAIIHDAEKILSLEASDGENADDAVHVIANSAAASSSGIASIANVTANVCFAVMESSCRISEAQLRTAAAAAEMFSSSCIVIAEW